MQLVQINTTFNFKFNLNWKIVCLIPLVFWLETEIAVGQQKKKPAKITGNAGLYGDFYNMNSDTIGAVAPRRPDALGRLVVNASLNIKDFSLPITLSLPTGQYGVIVPNLTGKNYKEVIKNPLNRIGIAPKYKWVQVLLGSQIPQYSELSVGDLAVFGAGISLTPRKFRLSCFAGTSQLAVEQDSSRNIQGIYSRKIYSAKIGVGHEDSNHIYLIGSMMMDDTSSLKIKPTSVMPQNGILTSIDFKLRLFKKAFIKGEIAGSAFTRDGRSKDLPEFSITPPDNIFIPKESSRFDYASVLSMGWDGKKFGVKVTGRYYGDGFVPMGYPFLQTDRLEVTIDPRFMLFKNKLQFSGSVGKRVNNISGIRATTTTQTIGSANLNIQFTDKFSLATSYSNFGFRNSVLNDTFKVEMITQSWSVSPSYSHTTKTGLHNFTLMYAQNVFNDFNTVSGALNTNDASNGAFSYMLSMLKNPFSVSTILSYFDNNTSFGRLSTKAANLTFGYKFFKKKLGTTAGLTVAENKINDGSSGFQVLTLVGLKYTLKKKISFAINGSLNVFKYGETRPGISYRENLLRTSLTYKF
ncbi:MAG: hypothetical protein ACKVQB_11300 [Bacteroidia bacterium]